MAKTARIIRLLWFFGNEIYLLQRQSERYVEQVAATPIGESYEAKAAFVSPFIDEIGRLRESIDATRRQLRQLDVDVPRAWCKLPIKLATKSNDETGAIELDGEVVAQWQAIRDDVDATIEELECAPNPMLTREPTAHSPDFRSVRWFGLEHTFGPNEAACVGLLWAAWEQGTPDVGGDTLKEAADISTNRVDLVFRNNPAWQTMIVPGATKGSYRLTEPTGDPAKQLKPKAKKTSRRARK